MFQMRVWSELVLLEHVVDTKNIWNEYNKGHPAWDEMCKMASLKYVKDSELSNCLIRVFIVLVT